MAAEMQALLAHTEWVRALARQLVRDPDLADDLTQETYVAALGARRRPIRAHRAWLGTVLRNLVWERLRGDGRRAARERRAARAVETPSALDVVERASVHRAVVAAVMELPEHYREIVLLRFFDGRTPTEIARERDIPIATVKTRLQRGLAVLRERLDRAHGGDGRSWMGALAPLLGPSAEPVAPVVVGPDAVGRAVVGRSVVRTACVLLGVGAVVVVGFRALRGESATAPRGDSTGIVADTAGTAMASPDGGATERVAYTGPTERERRHAERLVLEPGASGRLSGRVLDATGRQLPSVLVRFTPTDRGKDPTGRGTPVAISGPDGAFVLHGALGPGVVDTASPEFVTVLTGRTGRGARGGVTLIAAPRAPLAGRVLDEAGRALRGVRLELVLPAGLRTRCADDLDRSSTATIATISDDSGRFALDDAVRVDGAELVAEHEGYEEWRAAGPGAAPHRDLVVTLRRTRAGDGDLCGVVVDPLGVPVADARVSDGFTVTRTDLDGRFCLAARTAATDGAEPKPSQPAQPSQHAQPSQPAQPSRQAQPSHPAQPFRLIAIKEGHRPAVARRDRDARWPRDVRLTLGPEPLTIAGVVLDERGRPLAGARVWVDDPTLFCRARRVEPGSVETSRREISEVDRVDLPVVVESCVAGSPLRVWNWTRADADGRFALDGLDDRVYTVAAISAGGGPIGRRSGVRAGTAEVDVTVDTRAVRAALRGRVVSRHGEPVAGVRVRAQRTLFALRVAGESIYQQLDLDAGGWAAGVTTDVRTDRDGRFLLHDLPRGALSLRLEGERVTTQVVPLDASASEIGITATLRVRVRVVASDGGVDAVEVRDGVGNPLLIQQFEGDRRRTSTRVPVVDGRTAWLAVPDDAAILIAYRGGEELRRIAVQLTPGTDRQIRL